MATSLTRLLPTKSCKCFHTGSPSASLLLPCQNPVQVLFQKLVKLQLPEMGRRAAIPHAADVFTVGHGNKEVTSRILYTISVEINYYNFQNCVLMEELLNLHLGTRNEILRGNKESLSCGINSRVDEVILKR